MTFADDQVVYRSIADDAWGNLRLFVGGKDVTKFRGVPAQIGGYELQEPYGYGPSTFMFPQLTQFEVDAWGTGDLSWFDIGKKVELWQYSPAGTRVRRAWKGLVTEPNPTADGTTVACDGDLSGRLALRHRNIVPFYSKRDIGNWVWDGLRSYGITLTPRRGPVTGITLDSRGRDGEALPYFDGLLAEAMTLDGDQWTIRPTAGSSYEMVLKDRTTVDFTVHLGAAGVLLDTKNTLQELPTTILGMGTDPNGQKWINGRYPGLVQAPPPAFPNTGGTALTQGDTDADTDNNLGVTELLYKLVGMGYLAPVDNDGVNFTADVTEAVKNLQEDAGLSQTGNVGTATWDALFDLGVTGFSISNAYIAPLAQLSAVQKYFHTANGSISGRNPNFDPKRVEVEQFIDFGPGVTKKRAIAWSKKYLARLHSGKNHAGTLVLTTDVFAGSHTHGDEGTPKSRLDIDAGQNVTVRNFDGDTLFHISGLTVRATDDPASPVEVTCLIDTKARDLITLAEVVQRNAASRISPSRQFIREHRGTDANQALTSWSEIGGYIYAGIDCDADNWTVFPVIAGQEGEIAKLHLRLHDNACEFVTAIFAKRPTRAWLNSVISNPFAKAGDNQPKWTREATRARLDSRLLLYVAGAEDQPCGYWPGQKTGDDGEPSGDSVTGVWQDDANFHYHTFEQPVLYVAIYPKQACTVNRGRILWPQLEEGS